VGVHLSGSITQKNIPGVVRLASAGATSYRHK